MPALHIFRRDLRLIDNTSLNTALNSGEDVIPAFIIDPRQAGEHPYRSTKAASFLKESLHELDEELKKKGSRLYIFAGIAEEVIEKLLEREQISSVHINKDYTPFSRQRDEAIQRVCKQKDVEFHQYADALLCEPEEVNSASGTHYTVYTPFYHKASTLPVRTPTTLANGRFSHKKIAGECPEAIDKIASEHTTVNGGRRAGLRQLKHVDKHYEDTRDRLAATTPQLSAHHKFGTVSIRESYWYAAEQFGKGCDFIKELYWRDFFTHIAWHHPQVFGTSFKKKYEAIKWSTDEKKFTAWCKGQTGFPVVDAGMRELVETGFMHNRARMITASFLVKDLHIDLRWGERFFAKHLVDYDPAVNNGNWQWAASTGCDAQPYFRIFNPWRQAERFDSDCEYIKRWVPELQPYQAKEILKLEGKKLSGYAEQIVEHKEVAAKSKAMFASPK